MFQNNANIKAMSIFSANELYTFLYVSMRNVEDKI